MVACSAEMTGVSVNRLDLLLDDDVVREEHELGGGATQSIYCTVERINRNSDEIISASSGRY